MCKCQIKPSGIVCKYCNAKSCICTENCANVNYLLTKIIPGATMKLSKASMN